MAIVDLSLTSDELAESISSSVAAVVKRLSIQPKEHVYVIGNAADFDELCVPAIELLKAKTAACLWPRTSRSRAFPNMNDVIIIQEYIEPVPNGACIVLVQSVLLLWEEVIAMVARVLQNVRPERIVIGTCVGDRKVENRVKDYLEKRYEVKVQMTSEEYLPDEENRLEFEHRAFDLLDDRPKKVFPNMPEWVLSKMLGQDFDPSPETGPDPSGPTSGSGGANIPPKPPVGDRKLRQSSLHSIDREQIEKEDDDRDQDGPDVDADDKYRPPTPGRW